MQKLFVILMSMCVVTSTFADIASDAESADCTETVLGTTEDQANLQANWQANTLNMDWYNGNEKIASNTCDYDGAITVPQNTPTRTGYTFAGWKVVPECGLNNEDISIGSTYDDQHVQYLSINGTGANKGDTSSLSNGEWVVVFSYGETKGLALCSTTTGSWAMAGNPNQSNSGKNCWCRATNLNNKTCSIINYPWVFRRDYNDGVTCDTGCAFHCAHEIMSESYFRKVLFGK